MKNFLNNSLTKAVVSLMLITLSCGILIGLFHLITNPIIIQGEKTKLMESYKEIYVNAADFKTLNTSDQDISTVIVSVVEILDSSKQVIGYVYETNSTNSYGRIRLAVGVNPNNLIQNIIFLELTQTLGLDDTRRNIAEFIGKDINNVSDITSLVSGATYSYNTVKTSLEEIKKAHEVLELGESDPLEAIYGVGYLITVDTSFLVVVDGTTEIQMKSDIKNANGDLLGTLYRLKGFGVYNNSESRNLVIDLYLDSEEKIVFYKRVLKEEVETGQEFYEHTAGFFANVDSKYLKLFLGKTLSEILPSANTSTGSTNSTLVVKACLVLLEAYLRD